MFKRRYKQLINMGRIELEPFDMHKSQTIAIASSFAVSAVVCFSQCLKRDTVGPPLSKHSGTKSS